ncbi:integration host factor subunit alpha, partial [Acidithiobacillus ferrooxidans]|nr:integration host factor subunit alpha [Acidithiobacillus ferrooxidans]
VVTFHPSQKLKAYVNGSEPDNA